MQQRRLCPRLNSAVSGSMAVLCLACLLAAIPACRTIPDLGPANLEAPGWTVRQGQAVWQRPRGAPEIAGEILMATREDGRSFVQFSKNGFPLIIAQSDDNYWEVELPTQDQRHSGRGAPPSRLLILYLPRAMAGQPLPRGWSWTETDDEGWKLNNQRTGESLHGYFTL